MATPHVGRQVERQTAKNILTFCQKPRKASEIRAFLGLKDQETFQNNYLRPLMDEGVITLTIPNKPQSRLQKYITTEKGIPFATTTVDTGAPWAIAWAMG